MSEISYSKSQVNQVEVEQERVSSPCVSICCLDADDVCLGCYRTADEICDWSALGVDGKRQILLKVAERERASGRLL